MAKPIKRQTSCNLISEELISLVKKGSDDDCSESEDGDAVAMTVVETQPEMDHLGSVGISWDQLQTTAIKCQQLRHSCHSVSVAVSLISMSLCLNYLLIADKHKHKTNT